MSGFPKILYSLRGREIFRNPLTPAHLPQPTQNGHQQAQPIRATNITHKNRRGGPAQEINR